ncbi:hypothetical protein, partial [Streptomyces sp. NPDC005476]|uniref:hypothetical protein n=1 Tax=Streptomyces sp. NPDC005476 TaxID=3156882 RepID=UPI003451B001
VDSVPLGDFTLVRPSAVTPARSSRKTVTTRRPSKSNRAADDQMQAMRVMHEKMMNAKTPQERAALMDEQMKVMQNGMSMMEMMGAHSSSMPMSSRQGSMEMSMEMMQMMMQAMMDRQTAREHPAEK